ncbi:FHA domain-containing protein [Raineyella antarctica]|uniref:FHA domain-containing protein n=1 Tax=Raineyella antarctica TaxID=1577474 RepID=A0A1G6GFJ6_9ACTN|nr:FHA domain-containing protein [Raineyella antarctica]SDB80535.1 FHA domain-containing protein [Raineyella antarctica]
MSDILLSGLKIGYLALLWIFILLAVNVIRTDLFGRRVPASELPAPEPRPVKTRNRRAERTPAAPLPGRPAPASVVPARLIVTNGPQTGMAAEVDQAGTYVVIGRSPECAIVLEDDYISTRHARVVNGDQGLYLEDMGSTNGTYVNGRRISAPTSVGTEDEIRVGRTILKLEP